MPSSELAVVNRGILELTRDFYNEARRISALLCFHIRGPCAPEHNRFCFMVLQHSIVARFSFPLDGS